MTGKRRYPSKHKGRPVKSRYIVKNVEKYVGNSKAIICRSSWERVFCAFLDRNPKVIKWSSEETVIPYISPKDNKPHRYFVDFTVKFDDDSVFLIEIKPYKETIPPKKPKRKTAKTVQRYNREAVTYLVNQAKWESATKYAEKNSAKFVCYTENELRGLGLPV